MIVIAIIFFSITLNLILYKEKEKQTKLTKAYRKLLHHATEKEAKHRLEEMKKEQWKEKQP